MRLRSAAVALAAIAIGATVSNAAPTFNWSHRYIQADDQTVNKLVVDPFGNIVICGEFYTALNFGSAIPSVGFSDGYVAKFDPNGILVWVKQLGDVRPDRAWDVTTDPVGNVICVGHLSSAINDQDALIVKYAPDGTQRWLKRLGTGDSHFQTAMSVSTNLAKEIFVAGEFDGDFSLGGATLHPTGGVTFYMAKFDQNGNHLWSKRFLTSTPYAYNLSGLTTGADGQTTFTGVLLDSLDLGNGVLKSAGSYDIFLARFDTNGNALWSKRFGDAQDQSVDAIALSDNNQIAIAASTNGSVDFGGGPLTASGDYDPVVAVFNSAGNHLWSKVFNGSSNQYGTDVSWASNSDLLLVSRGTGTLDFGGGARTISGPINGVWVARLLGLSAGTHRWSTTYVSTGGMVAQIEEDNGKLILAGGVGGAVDFGGGETTGEPDYYDIYLAKYGDALTGVAPRINFAELGQNIPNPFNPTTSIPYTLRASGRVRINVYTTTGALVSTLDAGVQPAGPHTLAWNGRDANGHPVASGVYFYRMEGNAEAPRKMVLLK
jgi:hypothetical protein